MSKTTATLAVVENPEKKNHTAPPDDVSPSFPSRFLFAGRPGSGKGVACLNLLARGNFDTFTICHWDKKAEEWTSMLDDQDDFRMLGFKEDGLPTAETFDRDKRNCLVLDELPFDLMSKQERAHLERIANYFCSHLSISLFILCQDAFSVPISVRRAIDYFSLWPSPIKMTEGLLSRMLRIDLGDLFHRFCRQKHDFLTIDTTGQGPKVRLNFFSPIENV